MSKANYKVIHANKIRWYDISTKYTQSGCPHVDPYSHIPQHTYADTNAAHIQTKSHFTIPRQTRTRKCVSTPRLVKLTVLQPSRVSLQRLAIAKVAHCVRLPKAKAAKSRHWQIRCEQNRYSPRCTTFRRESWFYSFHGSIYSSSYVRCIGALYMRMYWFSSAQHADEIVSFFYLQTGRILTSSMVISWLASVMKQFVTLLLLSDAHVALH